LIRAIWRGIFAGLQGFRRGACVTVTAPRRGGGGSSCWQRSESARFSVGRGGQFGIMPLATAPLNTPTLEWPKAAPAILLSGLIAGAMDITAAFVTAGTRGATPGRVLQYIASGLLGPSSFQGGVTTMTLGLLLHFLIAFSATTVFYLASHKVAFLSER